MGGLARLAPRVRARPGFCGAGRKCDPAPLCTPVAPQRKLWCVWHHSRRQAVLAGILEQTGRRQPFRDRLELGIVGTNLVDDGHREHPFGQPIPRRVMATLGATF